MCPSITLSDVLHLARYTAGFEPEKRRDKCIELVARAHEASAYVAITGQAHPHYGDGSLTGLVLRFGTRNLPAHLDEPSLMACAIAFETLAELTKEHGKI